MNRIKLCTVLAGVTGLLTGGVNAADGVWTTGKTSDGGYAWTTASYWQDGVVPSEETDNAALQGILGLTDEPNGIDPTLGTLTRTTTWRRLFSPNIFGE